jgi:methylase of polypeptide subunit release factors
MIDMLKALIAQTARHPESTRSVVPNLFRDPVQNHPAGTQDPQNSLDSSLRWNDKVSGADPQAVESAQEAPIFDKNPKNIEVSEKNQLTSKVFSDLIIGDVGAGSGALGITAALELPGSQVELLEIDPAALLVAEQNAAKYKLELPVLQSDLLAGSQLDHDVLLCNLPYVPDAHTINQAAMSEPRLAIFGGEDGLDVFRSLFKQIAGRTAKPRLILTESLPPQHADLAILAATYGYQQVSEDDFIQAFELN